MNCPVGYLVETQRPIHPFAAWDSPATSTPSSISEKAKFQLMLPDPRSRSGLVWDTSLFPAIYSPTQKYIQHSRIREALTEVRKQGVKIVKPNEVQEYLQRYPELIDLVPEVARLARSHLPDAWLTLSVYHDPEIAEEEYLVLHARLATYDESIVKRLDEVAERYLPELVHREGWIQLTTDFHPPEDAYAL